MLLKSLTFFFSLSLLSNLAFCTDGKTKVVLRLVNELIKSNSDRFTSYSNEAQTIFNRGNRSEHESKVAHILHQTACDASDNAHALEKFKGILEQGSYDEGELIDFPLDERDKKDAIRLFERFKRSKNILKFNSKLGKLFAVPHFKMPEARRAPSYAQAAREYGANSYYASWVTQNQ